MEAWLNHFELLGTVIYIVVRRSEARVLTKDDKEPREINKKYGFLLMR